MGQSGHVLGRKGWSLLTMSEEGRVLTVFVVQIVSLTAQSGTPFSAAAEVHPAMVDPNDAKGIKLPLCMLASGDENAEDVEKFKQNLSGENHVETFGTQVHGWMAARYDLQLISFGQMLIDSRGDLKNDSVKSEYERGYGVLLDFYHKYL